jgi:hypothetical protein
VNACGLVIGFFCVVNFVVTDGLPELNCSDGISPLFVITNGLLRRGRPRFLPVLVPLTTGVSLVLVGVCC